MPQKRKEIKVKSKEEEDVEDESVNQFNNTMNISECRRFND